MRRRGRRRAVRPPAAAADGEATGDAPGPEAEDKVMMAWCKPLCSAEAALWFLGLGMRDLLGALLRA